MNKIEDYLWSERVGISMPDEAYKCSWDLIMIAVGKILTKKFEDGQNYYLRTFGMLNENGNYMVRFNRHQLFEAKELRDALYMAVLDVCDGKN
jgi:hypothetical protein